MTELKEILTRLDQRTDEIARETKENTIILARQEEQLKYHIKRTDLAEAAINSLRREIKPVKKHVDIVNALCKVGLAVVGLAATIMGIVHGFHL